MSLTYFTVVGSYFAAAGETSYDSGDPDLVPMSGTVTFTPLLANGDPIQPDALDPAANVVLAPVKVPVKHGQLKVNGDTGVRLLANAAGLNLTSDLHYRVDFNDGLVARGRTFALKPFTFPAPADDSVVDLAAVTPAATVNTPTPTDRGPRGYTTKWVVVNPGPPKLWQQYVTETNTYVGDPVDYVPDVSADVATQVSSQVPPAVTAYVPGAVTSDLAGRDMDVTDAGGGAVQFTLGGVPVGSAFPLPAAAWTGIVGKPFVEPIDGGAVGDGVADDTTALQTALDAAHNMVFFFRRGTYKVTATLNVHHTTSIVFDNGCVVRAGATIAGPVIKWGVEDATVANGLLTQNVTITGPGRIDCNNLADNGLYAPGLRNVELSDFTVVDANADSVVIAQGVSGYGIDGSVEVVVRRLKIDRAVGGDVPAGSAGVWMRVGSSDCIVSEVTVCGADICFKNEGQGNRFDTCHGWGWPDKLPSVIYDDYGYQNMYTNCVADTPTTYGFRMRDLGWRIIGGTTYMGPLGTDNVVSGIKIDQNNPSASIIGHGFIGIDGPSVGGGLPGTVRLAKDIDAAFAIPAPYFTAVGNIAINTVQVRVGGSDALRLLSAAGLADGYGKKGFVVEAWADNAVDFAMVKSAPAGYPVVIGASDDCASANVVTNIVSRGAYPVQINGNQAVSMPGVPSSATAAGSVGMIAADSAFIYVCTGTNTWKRAALSSW